MAYSLVAVDFLPPPAVNTSLARLSSQLARGVLRPLRQVAHSMGTVAAAFRQMVQAGHVGKVVASAARPSGAPPALPSRGCPAIVITGGTGGLALLIAQWLVQRGGPAHIHLLSRSGRANDPVGAALAGTAAAVSTAMADAGSPSDVAEALAAAGRRGPSLQAVLHASGVLADSLLDKQSAGSLRWGLPQKSGIWAWPASLALPPVTCTPLLPPPACLPLQACLCSQAGRARHPGGLPAAPARGHAGAVLQRGLAAGRGRAGQLRRRQRRPGRLVARLAGGRRRLARHPVGRLDVVGCAGGPRADAKRQLPQQQSTRQPLTGRLTCFPRLLTHTGMASEAVLRRLQRIGQGSITAEQGLTALAAALRGAAATAAPSLPQLAVNAFLWSTYLQAGAPPFFAELAPEAEAAPAALAPGGTRGAAAAGGAKPAAASAMVADPAAVREQVKREVAAAIQQARCGGRARV